MPAGTCPYCSKQISLVAKRGEKVHCPSCGHPLRVVAMPPAPPPPPQPPVSRQREESCDDFDFYDPQPLGDYRRSTWARIKWPAFAASIVVAAAIVILVVVASIAKLVGFTTDRDLAAVRVYLKENLNDPTWEEVRWWPGRNAEKALGTPFGDALAELAKEETWRESDAETKKRLENAKKPCPELIGVKVCRLKYRSKTPFGMILHDEIFLTKNGKAFPHPQSSSDNGAALWRYWFPNDPE